MQKETESQCLRYLPRVTQVANNMAKLGFEQLGLVNFLLAKSDRFLTPITLSDICTHVYICDVNMNVYDFLFVLLLNSKHGTCFLSRSNFSLLYQRLNTNQEMHLRHPELILSSTLISFISNALRNLPPCPS